MGRPASSYKKLLEALLPGGKAWSRDAGAMPDLLDGISQELSCVDGQIDSLVGERDSRTTSALLPEFEADLDITPETGATDEERRIAVKAALLAMGGQDPQYFIDLASAMDYVITITEYRPAWCGELAVGEPCGNQEVIFVWRVNLQYDKNYEDPTGADLEIVLQRMKPAHTEMIFCLVGPAFARDHSAAFDAMPALTGIELTGGAFSWFDFAKDHDIRYGGDFAYGEFTSAHNNLK